MMHSVLEPISPSMQKDTSISFAASDSHVMAMTFHDTSLTDGLDASRITVNTHTSILNVTEEEDDDDDDDGEENLIHQSFLLEEQDFLPSAPTSPARTIFSHDGPPQTPPLAHRCCTPSDAVSSHNTDSSLFDKMAESFVDSFCYSEKQESKEEPELWEGYRSLIESDIFDLLDWISLPTDREIKYIWSPPMLLGAAPPPRPQRYSLRARATKVRRLRQDGTVSPFVPVLTRETRSLDHGWSQQREPVETELETSIGFGLDPIQQEIELGYDSDPGEVSFLSTATQESAPVAVVQPTLDTSNVYRLVQETLNLTWNLTWHPGKNDNHHNPTRISVWLERGTLLQHSLCMVEPCLMWRRQSASPFTIRLLNICRILPAPADLDRSVYPLARASRSLILKSTETQKEYLLEAASEQERDEVLCRWKHVVARFATLAVMEDVRTIEKEFFRPSPSSRMLVPDYD